MKKFALYFALGVVSCGFAFSQTYNVLFNFDGYDGAAPSYLVFDGAGNLYGVGGGGSNECGAAFGCGTIFELSPSNGSWTEKVLYYFCSSGNCVDGVFPNGGIVLDKAGNIYGTTSTGGALGGGVVFEISPNGIETVLYQFCANSPQDCPGGSTPRAGLVMDSSGNLYGTTFYGGNCYIGNVGCGVVFELSPPSVQGGAWAETILYNFCSVNANCPDGAYPAYGNTLTFDRFGNLYGMTGYYGSNKGNCCGTIYKLSPQGNTWVYTVLYAPSDPAGLEGPLSLDGSGTIYGVFNGNSVYQYGGAFRLNAEGHPSIFGFSNWSDGSLPETGVVLDTQNHALYGTTQYGGIDYGTVFKLAGRPPLETVLHNFCSETGCADGQYPYALIEDGLGNLFGTTINGGTGTCSLFTNGCGLVFEITP